MAEHRLSVVMPVLNDGLHLAALLQQLQPLRQRGAQLVVVDGGSDDDSVDIASRAADVVLSSERGRARQMNAGAAQADGQWLCFLHADTKLPGDIDQWYNILPTTERDWGFFPVRFDGEHPLLAVVAAGINWRSRHSRVATGDQGLWLRRELFDALGGFPDIALMEDVALSRRLHSHARPCIWRSPLTTSSRRWQRDGIVRTVLFMWWLRIQYACGVKAAVLARRYYGAEAGE